MLYCVRKKLGTQLPLFMLTNDSSVTYTAKSPSQDRGTEEQSISDRKDMSSIITTNEVCATLVVGHYQPFIQMFSKPTWHKTRLKATHEKPADEYAFERLAETQTNRTQSCVILY